MIIIIIIIIIIIVAAHFSQHEAERVRGSPLSEVGKDLLHLFVASLGEGDFVLQFLGVKLPGAELGEVMHSTELDDGEDDVHVGDEQEHVEGRCVGNLGQAGRIRVRDSDVADTCSPMP